MHVAALFFLWSPCTLSGKCPLFPSLLVLSLKYYYIPTLPLPPSNSHIGIRGKWSSFLDLSLQLKFCWILPQHCIKCVLHFLDIFRKNLKKGIVTFFSFNEQIFCSVFSHKKSSTWYWFQPHQFFLPKVPKFILPCSTSVLPLYYCTYVLLLYYHCTTPALPLYYPWTIHVHCTTSVLLLYYLCTNSLKSQAVAEA